MSLHDKRNLGRNLMDALARVPDGPLHGTLVVAFDQQIAGSLASEELARAGAVVIKMEKEGGDPKRKNSPDTAFNTFNAGKFSLEREDTEEYRQLKRDLLSQADVIIDNRSQAAQQRDSILQEALHQQRDKPLIYSCISGFGEHDGAPAYDRVVQARTGMADLNNGLISFPLIDMTTGMEAAKNIAFQLAMIRGMDEEKRKSLGCIRLHTSMSASAMALMSNAIAIQRATGQKQSTLVPFELFDTADGRISVAIATDDQYARLCDVLKVDALRAFSTAELRLQNKIEIESWLQEILQTKTSEQWLSAFREHNVPAEPVHSFEEGVKKYAAEMIQPDRDGGEYVGSATSSSLFPRNSHIGAAPKIGGDASMALQLVNGLRTRSLEQLVGLARGKRGHQDYVYANMSDINFSAAHCNLPWAQSPVFEVVSKGKIRTQPINPGEVLITKNDEGIQYSNVAGENDLVAITERGDKYLISCHSLEKDYGPINEDGWHEAIPRTMKAVVATQPVRYNAPWGKTAYAPAGSVIVERDKGKVYAVSPLNFTTRYDGVDKKTELAISMIQREVMPDVTPGTLGSK